MRGLTANRDFKDLFNILNEEKVEYLVVGAHAVIFYGEPRYTKDLDVWINTTSENAEKVWRALSKYGAPLQDITTQDFTDTDLIYQIGIEPNRIDIHMGIAGVNFKTAFRKRECSTYDGIPINIISKKDLIKAKKAVERAQDILDIKSLEEE